MVRRAGMTPISAIKEGAAAILNLALSPTSDARSGHSFDRLREGLANARAYDDAARQHLRAISLALTGPAGRMR